MGLLCQEQELAGRGSTMRRVKSSLIVLVVVICAAGVATGLYLRRAYLCLAGTTASGVSARSANRMLWSPLRLPAAASDVTYHVDFGCCEAEFAVSETVFLRWCRDNGWKTEPISAPTMYSEGLGLVLGHSSKTSPLRTQGNTVVRGYTFSPPDGRGVFDADSSRACFWSSTFP